MEYVVVAYYTRQTPYEEEVKNLVASLEQFKLPYDITGIENQGSWQKNTQYKPYFLLQMLKKHFPKDVVYVDADAEFKSYPLLFDDIKSDIGCCIYKTSELLSGTLYLANNPRIYRLVERWQTFCFMHPDVLEQVALHKAVIENEGLITLQKLPYTYCKIFNDPLVGEAVIEQHQASRKYKNEVTRNKNGQSRI